VSVLVERRGAVLLVTIDRYAARNAIDAAVASGISSAVDSLDSDPELVAGVLTGAGGTFSAGMDLKAFLRGERPFSATRGFAGIVERPPLKPMIAAVEGHAVAGGFELALACDLVVAASDARFGLPEVRRGIVAAGGALLRLPRRMPYHIAVEWALTGRTVPAAEAHQYGLVNRLVTPGTAVTEALALADLIAANGPLAVAATKRILTEQQDWPATEAFELQRQISEPLKLTEDAREGAKAFAEKRPPQWQAR
jgi:enoyl-CoA hydratase